jgi:hypothetical protein
MISPRELSRELSAMYSIIHFPNNSDGFPAVGRRKDGCFTAVEITWPPKSKVNGLAGQAICSGMAAMNKNSAKNADYVSWSASTVVSRYYSLHFPSQGGTHRA